MLFSVIRREPEQESETWTERSRVKCMRVREMTDKRRLPEKGNLHAKLDRCSPGPCVSPLPLSLPLDDPGLKRSCQSAHTSASIANIPLMITLPHHSSQQPHCLRFSYLLRPSLHILGSVPLFPELPLN